MNTDFISLRIPQKYGAVFANSSRAFLTFADEIRYNALVIFCVSATPFILFLISAISDILFLNKVSCGFDDYLFVLVGQHFAFFDIIYHVGVLFGKHGQKRRKKRTNFVDVHIYRNLK